MASVDGGNLTRVSEQLEVVAVGDKARAEVLNAMIQSEKADGQELARLNEVGAGMRSVFESRTNSFEAGSGPQQFAMDGQSSRAPRLRVPDPGSWNREVFKNKDDGFHAWRESFELQVGSVWLGSKLLLEVLGDTRVENAEHWV